MITKIIKFLNEHYEDNNELVLMWLTHYVQSALMYEKQNWDGSWLRIQPAFPNVKVVKYRHYTDQAINWGHRTNRFMLVFDDNTEYDISIYRFKRYLRRYRFIYERDL